MKIPSLIASLFLATTTDTKSAFVASNNNDITSVSNLSVTLSAPVIVIPASDNQFQYMGRFAFNHSDGTQLFDMTGCEIRATLELSHEAFVTALMGQRHLPPPPDAQGNSKNSGFQENSFVVWVNGTRQCEGNYNATFATQKDQEDMATYKFNLTLNGSPLSAGRHNIRIMKNTEADWNGGDPIPNYMIFSGISLAATNQATEQLNDNIFTATLVEPPARSTRAIEFLGDSITAGFCNECHMGSSLSNDHREAFSGSWAVQSAELLDAEFHAAAWSGLGMVKNCCGGNTTMPEIFRRTLATVNNEDTEANAWNFSAFQPDVLVINLGTNDGNAVDDPKFHYRETYTDLVLNASAAYGKDLKVLLACGPMSSHYCQAVEDVIGNLSKKGVEAFLLDQTPFLNGTFGSACCGHPSIMVDTAMAKYSAQRIKEVAGW